MELYLHIKPPDVADYYYTQKKHNVSLKVHKDTNL